MTRAGIAAARLRNQRIAPPGSHDPAAIVAWLGAVQAQDFASAKWALALRMRGETTDAEIARAIDEGRILRTHLLRPTWHFVAADDIRWLLELTAPRIHQSLKFGKTHYGLTDALNLRAAKTIERALDAADCLTRSELGDHLKRARLPYKGVPLALLTMYAEIERVICSGPHRGKQPTYTLLDRRVPPRERLSRDAALGALTERYFRSHGPATIRDFVWWSGLTTADARRGLEIVRARSETIDGLTYWRLAASRAARTPPSEAVHLLPVYDEYLVAYRDLHAVPRGAARWGILPQPIVSRGQVVGEWKPVRQRGRIVLDAKTTRRLTRDERAALERAAARYGRFHGLSCAIRADCGSRSSSR